jgi:hypothetical protein
MLCVSNGTYFFIIIHPRKKRISLTRKRRSLNIKGRKRFLSHFLAQKAFFSTVSMKKKQKKTPSFTDEVKNSKRSYQRLTDDIKKDDD